MYQALENGRRPAKVVYRQQINTENRIIFLQFKIKLNRVARSSHSIAVHLNSLLRCPNCVCKKIGICSCAFHITRNVDDASSTTLSIQHSSGGAAWGITTPSATDTGGSCSADHGTAVICSWFWVVRGPKTRRNNIWGAEEWGPRIHRRSPLQWKHTLEWNNTHGYDLRAKWDP